MHEKTGHDNKGMSGHGFTFPVGGSVPVIFISMGETDLDTLQARQILPSDFSYGSVACELRTTTNFLANFCK
jgi:hypothetical protein